MSIWYKLSLISGLAPLTIGFLIFFGWLSTRADCLMFAGTYNIMAGLAFFLFGLVCLFVYGQQERESGNAYPVKKSLISLGVLLFNFPAAALALYSAYYVTSTSVATVQNNSSFEVNDLVLTERDLSYPLPPIGPGQEITEYVHFKYEGSVDYRLTLNGSIKEGIMFGYVSNGMGGSATLVIKRDGTIETGR